jgi:4-hydroxythreonine-4-phosphate dehydrogenase
LEGQIDGTVTAPIHKEALNAAGHDFPGHTEIYAHLTKTREYAMLLANENLRVIHVSTHVSLREACDMVKKDRILAVIRLAHDACRQLGIESPRIGVAGLNPHSSDGGLFGREEEEEISPAVEEARALGMSVEGPIPPDTLFPKAKGGLYDVSVAMYHDQGHIPLKLLGFVWDRTTSSWQSVSGVNVTLGLPIIRASVDHGTAFGKAGKGTASPDSLVQAIMYAARLASNQARAP